MTTDVLEQMRKQAEDASTALRRRRQMDDNVRFALEHLEEWRQKHPNSWIAVNEGRLVAAEPSRELLLDALKKQSIALDGVYVDFLSEEKAVLIL